MKEMTIHSVFLALCPRVTLLLPYHTQTSGSASVTVTSNQSSGSSEHRQKTRSFDTEIEEDKVRI